MRLSLRLQRCLPGRSVRMLRKVEDTMVGVGMEVAGGATITTPKVAVEDMKEEGERMGTGEAKEEAPEGERCREAWETEVEEREAVIIRAIIKIQEVVREEEGEVVMEEEGTTKAASRTLATMEEEEVVTMTITTKMEAGIRRGAGLADVEGEGEEEAVEEEEDKEEAGEEEGGRILTKEDSLNSSSNMAGSTTTKPALINSNTTLAKETVWGTAAETPRDRLHIICEQILNALF